MQWMALVHIGTVTKDEVMYVQLTMTQYKQLSTFAHHMLKDPPRGLAQYYYYPTCGLCPI